MRPLRRSLSVPVLICFGGVAGCTPSSEIEAETNSRLVQRFVAETNAQNFSTYDELLSRETIAHLPGGVDLNREQVETNERTFAEAFPDASRTVDFLLAEGDRVMIRETFRGTRSGAYQGIPATGSSVELTANIVYRIANGRIAESWVEADFGDLANSLERAKSRATADDGRASLPQPTEIIDLGALVTEDLPQQFWGTKFRSDFGFDDLNSFKVIRWQFGPVSGSNSYYTLFNHGGPHVDAPNHMGLGPGIDSYRIESFVGPLKIFDLRQLPLGRNITIEMLQAQTIKPGDVVFLYTGYVGPKNDSDIPASIALTYEAAEFLATIPIRAIGTDAFGVDTLIDQRPVEAASEVARTMPIHHAFLSRGIPAYEQLLNLDRLVGKNRMYFVGVPLNIKDGDGMMVRPVVLIY